MKLSEVDIYDPDIYQQGVPHEAFKVLRREAPVFRQRAPKAGDYWAVTRYDDVWKVQLDTTTYSSERMGAVMRDLRTPEELAETRLIMLNMDPPKHTRYRKLVNRGFSPRMVERLEAHIRDLATQIIDRIAPRGECDFVADVAAELPLQVILEMMGVPLEDRHLILEWSNKLIGFDDPEYAHDESVGREVATQMYLYANQLAEQRKTRPHGDDDLVSVLMHAEVEGEKLSVPEFDAFFLLLTVAGNETTRNLMSGAMQALATHPEQRGRLLANPGLLPTAIEEFLRWVTPVMQFRRTVTCDTELAGQKLHEGDKVIVYYISANRDETKFKDPDRFDVGRDPNDHLAFGIGSHYCLGANLARLEIRVMFEELLRRLPDIELAGPVERLRSNFINGTKRMPIRFAPHSRR